ncbi:hypothetical protein ACFPFM_02430 [Saccharothrix xinjiangensis]|uniref:Secreted protein n=1 Tax=Saccharothrix xinjiangensis TaxID=204798 RepID=A0ABV9XT35_9PSEU
MRPPLLVAPFLLVAPLLLLIPLLPVLLALSAVPAFAAAGLHACGTSVHGDSGTGWCSGHGVFRLVVACDDGDFARGAWLTVNGGRGTVGVSCVAGSPAVGAEIEPREP